MKREEPKTKNKPTSHRELGNDKEAKLPSKPATKPVAVDEVEADAHDEALLDLVAMEMAAPDGGFDVTEPEFEQAPVAAARLAEPEKAPPAAETAVVQQPAGGSAPASARRRTAPRAPARAPAPARSRCGAFAGFDHHRERDFAKTQHPGQRSAGADPAHEPDREDRVVLLKPVPVASQEAFWRHRHPVIGRHCAPLRS